MAMAQMSTTYDGQLNAKIAKWEGLEQALTEAIWERDSGWKELEKFWEERQKLIETRVQKDSLNRSLQNKCLELERDQKDLQVCYGTGKIYI